MRPCILCGGTVGRSREHVYPEWMHKYLSYSTPSRFEYSGSLTKGDQEGVGVPNLSLHGRPRKGERTISTKIEVVCGGCNNGWMSQLEEFVKEPLVPLILGKKHVFS